MLFDEKKNSNLIEKDLIGLYEEIYDRIIKYYPYYEKIGKIAKKNEELFKQLSISEKRKVIQTLLIATKANSERIDSIEYGDKKIPCSSRLQKNVSFEKAKFYSSSVTGMFRKEL